MKSFTIAIKNVDDVKSFIGMGDSEYISVLLIKRGVYFMTDSSEIYTHYYFSVISKFETDDATMFRLHKKQFLELLIEGFVEFRIDGDSLSILYKDTLSTLIYTFKTKYQVDIPEKYMHRLDLISDITRFPMIDIGNLGYLLRVGKAINAPIKCSAKMGSIDTKSAIIFTKVDCTNFTCSAKLLNLLYRYGTHVYNAQNYLVYNSLDKVIMITKYREAYESDIDFMLEQKTQFRVVFNPKNMVNLCRHIKINDGSFILDLENERAIFEEGVNSYEVKTEVIDIMSAKIMHKQDIEDDTISLDSLSLDFNSNSAVDMEIVNKELSNGIPALHIPSNVIKSVILQLPLAKQVSLIIKRKFVILKIGPVGVVFGRKDYIE